MSPAYSAWNIQVLNDFPKLDLKNQMEHLLQWGVLAANAHNTQAWRFKVQLLNSTIDIYIAPDELLIKTDKEGRQTITSIGCLIENINLAATCYNCHVSKSNVAPRDQLERCLAGKIPLATLKFENKNIKSPDQHQMSILESLRQRRSNRMKFDSKNLPEQLLESIKLKAQNLQLSLHMVTDMPTRLAISELQYMADRTVIALPGFREELKAHLISNADQQATRGMPGHTFGLSDESTAKLQSDLVKDGALNPDWAVGFAAAGRDGIKSAPALFIACGNDDTESWIAAGQFFQYAAVTAQGLGIASAYNASMVESLALNAMLKVRLGTFKKPICVFRMGYPLFEVAHSPRRSLSEIVEFI